MGNKIKAIVDVLGCQMKKEPARKFFFNVFHFFLYHDTKSFLEAMDFRARNSQQNKLPQDYLVFSYMLKLLLKKHPKKLLTLCPISIEFPSRLTEVYPTLRHA